MLRKSSSTTAVTTPVDSDTTAKRTSRKRKAKPALAVPLKQGHQIDAKGRITVGPVEQTPAPSGAKASKQETILGLLRRPEGATLAQMMKVTGWQAHSVRGFLSGTVRKKLGLSLISETIDGHRHYRIDGGVA